MPKGLSGTPWANGPDGTWEDGFPDIGSLAKATSGDSTKALYGDGSFKVPSGGGGGLTPAASNLVFYANAATGSDSNPGTSGAPFATIQKSVNVGANYDYQHIYFPTFNVADGTYVETNGVALPQLVNLGGLALITGNQTTWTNVVIDGNNNPVFAAAGINCTWGLSGMRVTNGGILFFVQHFANISLDQIDFAFNDNVAAAFDVGNGGNVGIFNTSNYSVTETGSGTTHSEFIDTSDSGAGTVVFQGPTVITFTNAISFDYWADSVDYSNVQMLGHIVNPTNLTLVSGLFFADVLSNIDFDTDWLALSAPAGVADASSIFQGFPLAQVVSGAPTTSNLMPGQYGVFDTGSGWVLAGNKAGTIVSVALN